MRILFLLFFIFLFFPSCQKEVAKIKPTLTTITESVYASATIVPNEMYTAYSVMPGLLDRVYVKEGDVVKAGQTLAQIATDNQRINLESAQSTVNFAKKNKRENEALLSGISDEIKSVREQIKLDSLNYERQQNLWAKNIGSKNEVENKKLKYQLIKNNLALLQKKYRQTKLELENSYEQSQYNLQKVKSNWSDYFIKAKMDGRVYELRKEEGELIGPQEQFARIGKTDDFIIELLIDEVDVAKIDTGQLAFITLDAYKEQVFPARISKIYPLKNSRTQTFKVEARFQKGPPKLFAGLSGEANIVLTKREKVLTIPLDYLLAGDRVQTKDDIINVRTGLKNMNRVEILSGIDTATVLLKPEAL